MRSYELLNLNSFGYNKQKLLQREKNVLVNKDINSKHIKRIFSSPKQIKIWVKQELMKQALILILRTVV